MNLIKFEGNTVAVIAPEDLENMDAELARLRRQLQIAREGIGEAIEKYQKGFGYTVEAALLDTLKKIEEVR